MYIGFNALCFWGENMMMRAFEVFLRNWRNVGGFLSQTPLEGITGTLGWK